MSQEIESWMKRHEEIIEGYEKELSLAHWALATTGKKEHQEEVARLRNVYWKYYADPKKYQEICSFREQKSKCSPTLARQIELNWLTFAGHQMDHQIIEELTQLETEVQGHYSNFRGEMNGKKVNNNDIREILKNEIDCDKRRLAWEASKQIGPIVDKNIHQMVTLRNQNAKKNGFKNYYVKQLELDELNQDDLFTLLTDLEEKTRGPFQKAKDELDDQLCEKFKIAKADLRPWHYGDPFFQEAPATKTFNLDAYYKDQDIVALSKKTYEPLGLEIQGILDGSDLFPKDGKDQHAFCMAIARSRDVRVLCNIVPTDYWMSTMLHELGHGIYDWYIPQDLPYSVKHPAHILSTEAIAMLFGRLSRNALWLEKVLGLPASEAKSLQDKCQKQQSFGMLILVRWILVMCHFERAMYEGKIKNLNTHWWELVKKFQFIDIGENRDQPDWAAKLHLALAPVYYQNYLLGELIASQLQNHIEKNCEGPLVGNKKAGTFLINDYFIHGGTYRWDELVQKATGEALNTSYFAQQFI